MSALRRLHARGAATLAMTTLLTSVLLLSVVFTHRSVLFEGKSSVNQYRAAQAREAAEAGLAWTLAQLNTHAPVESICASNDAGHTALRDLLAEPWAATCQEQAGEWHCDCAPDNANDPALASTQAFTVAIGDTAQTDRWQLRSTGTSLSQASLTLHTLVGRVPGLRVAPPAALTVRGIANFSQASFAIHHPRAASGGLTLHSAYPVDASTLALHPPPGTPRLESVADGDASLARRPAPFLFTALFGMDATAWRGQPVVREVSCEQPCDDQLESALAASRMIWLRGGLRLNGPLAAGSPDRPVLLVADGPVQFQDQPVLHGLLYGTSPTWVDPHGAHIHGAVVLENDLHAAGTTQIHHDADVLDHLRRTTGTFAHMPGAWRDH